MGERKGLAKYYPPDFDPSKLSRVRKPKDKQISSHFMLPMSIRCETCGEFMGAGLKFNAKKSTASETYLGTKIYRFSMRCKACPASFVIRTDPEHHGYICEAGAKRNFEPWKAEESMEQDEQAKRNAEKEDILQAVENKTAEALREMEELDALDELKATKARAALVTSDTLLQKHREAHELGSGAHGEATDEQLAEEARVAFAKRQLDVRRVDEAVEDERTTSDVPRQEFLFSTDQRPSAQQLESPPTSDGRPLKRSATLIGKLRVKTRKRESDTDAPKAETMSSDAPSSPRQSEKSGRELPRSREAGDRGATIGLVALADYADDSDSSSSDDS